MSIHSDRFNELPFETRTIACALMLEYEIRNMEAEKVRLKNRYDQSIKEINEKITYCKRDLDSYQQPTHPSQ